MSDATIQITPAQIDFFHREGYLVIPTITTPEEVARIREIYDGLFVRQAGREEGNQFDLAGADEEGATAALPQILMPVKYAPDLAHTLYRANALAISRQLFGPSSAYKGEHAIFKPARYGAETPWHQDEAYWNPELDYNEGSFWMPLQEATPENGCMYFIPGSHRLEVLPHHSINNDPRIHGLEVDMSFVDLSQAVACPLPAGGATVHAARTLHYTPPNRSAIPRRAYILGFGTEQTRREAVRRFPWNEMKQTAREVRAERTRKHK
jgi:ectoine hydroxylase-related dioxygenase (phytanoyl-CoA dioxygenase family)